MPGMSRGWRLGLGIPTVLIGLVCLVAGVAILATVGPDGEFDLRSTTRADGSAVVFDALSLRGLPSSEDLAITIEASVTGDDGRPVFVGVGPTPAVAAYLEGVAHERVVRIGPGGQLETDAVQGAPSPRRSPADVGFWVAQGTGATAELAWTVVSGDWSIVIMNADATEEVNTVGIYRLRVPLIGPFGVGLTVLAAILLAGGGILTASGARMPARRRGDEPAPDRPDTALDPSGTGRLRP
jgi:hypothetical protein